MAKKFVQDLTSLPIENGDEILYLRDEVLYKGTLPPSSDFKVLEAAGEAAATGVSFTFPYTDTAVTPRMTAVIVGQSGNDMATFTENILKRGSETESYAVDVAIPDTGFVTNDNLYAAVTTSGNTVTLTFEALDSTATWYAYLYTYPVKIPNAEPINEPVL